MCIVDHATPNVAYLVSAKVESFAPPAILTRLLAHYAEVELSDEQIHGLLDLTKEYSTRQVKAAVAFANVTAALDLVEARADVARKRSLLKRHAELFRQHEELLLAAYEQTVKLLSATQMRRAAAIYQRDTQRFLAQVGPSLNRVIRQRAQRRPA